jgi:hypothetical protein
MFMMLIRDWCQVTLITHLNQVVQLIEQLLTRAMNLTQTKKKKKPIMHFRFIKVKLILIILNTHKPKLYDTINRP